MVKMEKSWDKGTQTGYSVILTMSMTSEKINQQFCE